MPNYYTESGQQIRNPEAYASTGAPMYKTKYGDTKDFNVPTTIYKMDLQNGKKYIGKTKDVNRRMDQHFSGNGAKVTKKFKPINGTVLDEVPGFFSDQVENEYTQTYIQKHGYQNVRGGYYTNSKTLKYEPKNKSYSSFDCDDDDYDDDDDDDCDECYSSFDCDDDDDDDDDCDECYSSFDCDDDDCDEW